MENSGCLVSMEAVKCERINGKDTRYNFQPQIDALVQGFSNGSTRVLCENLTKDNNCKKAPDKPDKKQCIFIADSK